MDIRDISRIFARAVYEGARKPERPEVEVEIATQLAHEEAQMAEARKLAALETLLMQELRAHIAYGSLDYDLYHWRTQGGLETRTMRWRVVRVRVGGGSTGGAGISLTRPPVCGARRGRPPR